MSLTLEILREIKFFQAFSDPELTHIMQSGQVVKHEAYANIVIEGEMSYGFYIVLHGMLGVYKTDKASGNSYDVAHLRENNFFGEMSLFDEGPRAATVRALTQCELLFVPKDGFTQFVNASVERRIRFYESCIKALVDRLRELDDSYVMSQYQLWQTALKHKDEVA